MPHLERPILAPLVSDILKNPDGLANRAAQPVYAICECPSDLSIITERRNQGLPLQWIEPTTEADGLRDLGAYFDESIELLSDQRDEAGSQHLGIAQKLRTDLRFIGANERSLAEAVIADRLLARLDSSPDGELHISVPQLASEGLILQGIGAQLASKRPDAIHAIQPFDPYKLPDTRTRQRRQRNGVIIADDWTLSGTQVAKHINFLTETGLRPDDIEAHYLCAADRHVQKGIKGVRVLSHYTYPAMAESVRDRAVQITVTGTHAAADYGFSVEVKSLSNYLGQSSRTNHDDSSAGRFPLLFHIAKIYKWSRYENVVRLGDAQAFEALDAALAVYRQGLARFANADG